MVDDDYSVLHANSNNSSDHRVSKSFSSASPVSSSGLLNPRSCIICRRRKVKCDKKQPCSNCVKAHNECVFPAPGRAPRKPRKPQDAELMERLKRLEGVVLSLGAQVQEEGEVPSTDEAKKTEADDGDNEKEETHEEKIHKAAMELRELKRQKWEKESKSKQPPADTGLEDRFGRLVVGNGRSRYINPSFWASLSHEVEDIKGLLDESDEEDFDNYPSPESVNSSSINPGYIFNLSSTSIQMSTLHPPPEHVSIYWYVFKENIDPLVKVIHVPSTEQSILEAATHLDKLPRGHETLMFAIYYGAVTSLWPDECKAKFGEEKSDLLARYRFGVEQALARADFLQSDEVVVLQAFILFLMCLRRNDDARVIWTLTGLVIRMAHTLGLHRDGSHYSNLTPFQMEMRRRVWWQAVILDSRASEDHGCDPSIIDTITDTQFPRNLNDSDLYPEMTDLPESKPGCTEMTFGLIRFKISSALRKLQYVPAGKRWFHGDRGQFGYHGSKPEKADKPGKMEKIDHKMHKMHDKMHGPFSMEKKEKMIREFTEKIEQEYLKDFDLSVPLQWVIHTVARLIMAKMWLMLYHPYQRKDGGASLPQEKRDQLFHTALENLECAMLLETEDKTLKYSWLFKTYIQWHAIAFLLSELCVRTSGQEVERAWRAIDLMTRRRWDEDNGNNKLKSHLWKPLRRLMAKAKAEREKAMVLERENTSSSTTLGQNQAPILPAGQDSLMSLDFGVERLYPSLDANQNFDGKSMLWINPGLQPPVGLDQSMSMDITDPSSALTAIPQQLSVDTADSEQLSLQPGFDGTWMAANSDMSNSNLIGDALNWEQWDDMVQELGMQMDSTTNGHSANVPSVFGSGAGWY